MLLETLIQGLRKFVAFSSQLPPLTLLSLHNDWFRWFCFELGKPVQSYPSQFA